MIIVGLVVAGMTVLCLTKEELKRDEYEDSRDKENESLLSDSGNS